ncbi:hypothetical protein [Caenimonas koreensis]|uniref:hypothetical protein n=1 Tax=Caenimonas koreensis TaxID=367474 RepID=UPI003782DF20
MTDYIDKLVDAALLIWPPYGLRFGNPIPSEVEPSSARQRKGWPQVPSDVQQAHLSAAESIYRSEQERKKTIEDKASNFFVGATMSSSLVLALPTFLLGKIEAPQLVLFVIAASFGIAALYLLGSAYYATRVRGVGKMHVINSGSLEGLRVKDSDFRLVWAMTLVDMARRNEPILILKANHLSVAEQMFLRGAIAAVLAGLTLVVATIVWAPSPVVPTAADVALRTCMQSNIKVNADLATAARANGELRASAELALKQEAAAKVRLQSRANSKSRECGRCCNSRQADLACPTVPTPQSSDPTKPSGQCN